MGVWSQTGDRLVVASRDHVVRVFDGPAVLADVACGRPSPPEYELACPGVGWSVLDVDMSPASNSIVASSWSSYLQIFRLQDDGRVASSLVNLAPAVRARCCFAVRFSGSGARLVCATNAGGALCVFDTTRGVAGRVMAAHVGDVNTADWADEARENVIISGGDDAMAYVWDLRVEGRVAALVGHTHGIVHAAARGDGRHVLTNAKDQRIKVWDLRRVTSQPVRSHAAIAEVTRRLRRTLWDYRSGASPQHMWHPNDGSLLTLTGHSVLFTLTRARFSPLESTGGRYVYAGGAGGRVTVWNMKDGLEARQLRGHAECVRDVAWHPTAPVLVSTSWDRTVRAWRAPMPPAQ